MAQVTVKSRGGQLGTIEDSDLQNALKHGFSLAGNDEIKAHNDEIEHGSGLLNPLIAGIEALAAVPTFGLSRELENASGLTTPEAQAGRASHNPMAQFVGTVGGFFTPGVAGKALEGVSKLGGAVTEGAAKLIGKAPEGAGFAARALRNVPAAAAGAAAEGAAFGAGQTVNEHALGELGSPDHIGEKIVSNIGYGALMAGALGGALEGGANAFGKSLIKTGLPKNLEEAKIASYKNDIQQGVTNQEAAQAAMPEMQNQMATPEMQTPFKEFPKSIEEIQNAVKTNFPVVPEGLPSSGALKEAVAGLPDLQFKPHNLQYESLTDQGARDFYKTYSESQGEEAKAIRDYEALQKSEATTKLDNTIQSISGESPVSSDPVKGGNSLIDSFSKQYEAEKQELKPMFKQFDEIAGDKQINPLNPLLKLHDVFPKIGKYLDQDAEGVFQLAKYRPSMSMSKNTYGAIKDLVSEANAGELTLSGLRDIRESMRDRLTINAAPRDYAQIGSIRKALMDEMQDHVSQLAPDLKVRDTFKRYAINEQQREVIEKILGGSVSDKATFGKMIKPEDALGKIFSNTVSVNAAKDILGKDFGKVVGDYLAQTRAKVTDEVKNGVSSNTFATFLKSKRPELAEALADNPLAHKRLEDLTTYMRVLPDSPSSNPSGTAKVKTILEKMAGLSRIAKPTNAIEDIAQHFAEKAGTEQRKFTMGEVLAGKTFQAAKDSADENALATSHLARIGRYAEDSAYALKENAKAIFSTGSALAKKAVGLVGSKLVPSPTYKVPKNDDGASLGNHHDVFARINELQSDPQKMIDTLEKSVASIYPHAPEIAQSIQAVATRATEFLATKLPPQMPPSAFGNDKYEPSKSELAQFERYYNVIEDPMHAMRQIKTNDIVPETVEALSTVYPQLYNSMKMAIIEEASDVSKSKPIPYALKQSISMFIGEPVDQSFSQQAIQANQQSFMRSMQQHQAQSMGQQKSGDSKLTLAKRSGLNRGVMEA